MYVVVAAGNILFTVTTDISHKYIPCSGQSGKKSVPGPAANPSLGDRGCHMREYTTLGTMKIGQIKCVITQENIA